MLGIAAFLYVIFITIAWLMTFYTMNFYYLCYQSRRNIQNEKMRNKNINLAYDVLPLVTIQLPLYNEKYVAQRLIDAVCNIDYPKSKLEIQVLDDSDDDTVEIIESIVSHYSKMGYNIFHAHRANRVGFKAGALKEGMKSVKGEFIAIFDADFIPPRTFLNYYFFYFSLAKL
jgi:cellulose synthase/poly-beta-1,6-N-acetylglucosamine synthase-like glycosyltransferase